MTIAEEFAGWPWELGLADLPPAVRESASLHLLNG
jgi:hypothetical protein